MYKILIRITGSRISNQLRHVNTICKRWRDITVEKGIADDRKVKIVTFIWYYIVNIQSDFDA